MVVVSPWGKFVTELSVVLVRYDVNSGLCDGCMAMRCDVLIRYVWGLKTFQQVACKLWPWLCLRCAGGTICGWNRAVASLGGTSVRSIVACAVVRAHRPKTRLGCGDRRSFPSCRFQPPQRRTSCRRREASAVVISETTTQQHSSNTTQQHSTATQASQ